MSPERTEATGIDYALEQVVATGCPASAGSSRVAYHAAKRLLGVLISAGVIVIGFIPGVMLSVAVSRDTKGSAIYTQERVGRGGRKFKLYKFRTMVADADDVEKYLSEEQLRQWRLERKVDDDPRITGLGRVLRRTSIDEFPQFLNVFLGQMSVVGPRAVTEDELNEWYTPEQRQKLLSVPMGITGLWQTGPRNEYDFESGKRQRMELDYVDAANLALDAKLFFRTFGAMRGGTGR